MAIFPKKESEIVTLAELMINGLTEHEDDFPSCSAAALTTILSDYKTGRDAYATAEAETKTAVETKNSSMEVLTTTMKDMLKRAETDVTAQPEKLAEIGWAPRQTPQPVPVPSFPGDLRTTAEGQGSIFLEWERPQIGGPVRNYIIERCQQLAPGGDYGPWTIAGSTYNCEATLTDQPVDKKLMYAVKAVNNSGESAPSNIVVVTLP